jgi:hypothetical protein
MSFDPVVVRGLKEIVSQLASAAGKPIVNRGYLSAKNIVDEL